MGRYQSIAVTLVLLAGISLPTVAHAPSTFMIILRDDGPVPGNATENLWINDSVWFRNVDTTENQTHTVVVDIDGDGLFNGSEDITSTPLTATCELDEEGNKSDSSCEVVLIVTFNETNGYTSGWYGFEDRRSDGNSTAGMLYVRPDNHTMMTDSTDSQNTNESIDSATQQTKLETESAKNGLEVELILLSIASGFAALSVMLIMLREIRRVDTESDSEE